MLKNIKDGILLWFVLSVTIPILITLWNIFFVGILGVETDRGFIGNFEMAWVSYYFNGEFLGIVMWRIHLFFLSLSLIFSFLR